MSPSQNFVNSWLEVCQCPPASENTLWLSLFSHGKKKENPFLPLKYFVLAKGPVKSQDIKVVLTTLGILCPLPEIAN